MKPSPLEEKLVLRAFNLWPISSQTMSDLVLHLLNRNCLEFPLPCLANFYWSFETYVNHFVNILNPPCRLEPKCTTTPHLPPALALIIPLLVVLLKRKHIHLFLLPNYKALESNVLCLSTFMFFSPVRNYWSHLRNHFYLSSCVRTKVVCFLTDLAKFYWRFNCDQYVEIQFCYILLKIIDSFLLANSSTDGWALGTREILGLGLDVVIHIKSSGLFRDRTPNPLPWRSCWKMILDLGRIKIRKHFRSVPLLQNYKIFCVPVA